MDFAFETPELRALCESQEEAERALGYGLAKALRTCIAEIDASASLQEFVSIRPCSMTGDLFYVSLGEGHELVFRQGHINAPEVDGLVDRAQVYRVRILRIGTIDA